MGRIGGGLVIRSMFPSEDPGMTGGFIGGTAGPG